GAHFAPLIYNAFAYPDTEQDDLFDQKVLWMVEHGYEIGNHTWQHTDLTDISDEEFMMTVAKPQIYMNELLGDHPGNASHILTLPYGSSPDRDLHPAQRQMMMDGFAYEGHQIDISGALLVGADPAPSPASTEWHKLWIPRIQMFDESVDFWFGMIERGEIIVYTSDGNPETIAVPDPQHPALDGTLNQEALQADGVSVLHYRVDDGQIVAHGANIEGAVVPPIRTGGHAMRGVTHALCARSDDLSITPGVGARSRMPAARRPALMPHRKIIRAAASAAPVTPPGKPAGERKIVVAETLGYCW